MTVGSGCPLAVHSTLISCPVTPEILFGSFTKDGGPGINTIRIISELISQNTLTFNEQDSRMKSRSKWIPDSAFVFTSIFTFDWFESKSGINVWLADFNMRWSYCLTISCPWKFKGFSTTSDRTSDRHLLPNLCIFREGKWFNDWNICQTINVILILLFNKTCFSPKDCPNGMIKKNKKTINSILSKKWREPYSSTEQTEHLIKPDKLWLKRRPLSEEVAQNSSKSKITFDGDEDAFLGCWFDSIGGNAFIGSDCIFG